MTIYDLLPNLDAENHNVEFKGRLDEVNPIKWVKTVAGFANGKGGDLCIGVEDKTRVIVSMTAKERDHQSLVFHNFVTNLTEPYIDTKLEEIPIGEGRDKRYILKVKIRPALNLPVLAKSNGDKVVYVRDYGLTRSATANEIIELVTRNPAVSYDAMSTESAFDEKDFTDLFTEYQRNHGKQLTAKALLGKGFCAKDGTLTKGGLLFRDGNNDDITLLTICRYPGITKGDDTIINRIQINGSIVHNIREAVSCVMNLTGDGIKKTDTGEEEFAAYPRRALVEGIANAYAHRNYYRVGAKIQVDIFLDRVEITSPGCMVAGVNYVREKNLSSIIPEHRNPFIVKTLTLVGLTQAEGTGFDKITELYLPYDEAHKPYLDSNEESATLVLPNVLYQKGVVGADNPFPDIVIEEDEKIGPSERRIISYCYLKPRTVKEIADALNVSVSTYLRERVIRELIRQGFLLVAKPSPLSVVANRNKTRVV